MREILFRGKRLDNGEWVTGTPFIAADCCKMIHAVAVHPDFVDEGNVYYSEGFPVDPETVGQFTGLTDKNGKRIFEGDIVRDGYLFGKVVFATAQDGFDGMAGFMVDDIDDGLQNYNGFWHEVKVIGNIHDNPELLEVK